MQLSHNGNIAWIVVNVGGAAAVRGVTGRVFVLIKELIFHTG